MSKWYYTPDREESLWYEAGDTREDAIKQGMNDYPDYGFWIALCTKQDFAMNMTGQDVLEELQGHNEDIDGEDNEFIWDSTTKEQQNDLGEMVTAAIHAWVEKHKIDIGAHVFGAIEHEEFIKGDLER